MRLPSDYKRDYKFKSDPKKDRLSYIIAIVLSVIVVLLMWFVFQGYRKLNKAFEKSPQLAGYKQGHNKVVTGSKQGRIPFKVLVISY